VPDGLPAGQAILFAGEETAQSRGGDDHVSVAPTPLGWPDFLFQERQHFRAKAAKAPKAEKKEKAE